MVTLGTSSSYKESWYKMFIDVLNCTRPKIAIIEQEDVLLDLKILNCFKCKQEWIRQPLSFGKNALTSIELGFSIMGPFPHKIYKRWLGIYSAGLVEQAKKWINKYRNTGNLLDVIQPEQEYVSSSLKGNIGVVFVVIPFGIAPAFVALLVEIFIRIVKRLKLGVSKPITLTEVQEIFDGVNSSQVLETEGNSVVDNDPTCETML